MQALFVHGMGRSPSSGWPMLWHLKRAGLVTSVFGYAVSREDFDSIRTRLAAKIRLLAARGDYILIGHSLGGVLLRAAVNSLPRETRQARRLFLLGSPLQPARLGQPFYSHPVYRLLTRDCGQLLGSAARMAGIGPVDVPTTSVAGTRGPGGKRGPFAGEANDGVLTVSEVSAQWITDQVHLETIHTLLPSSRDVAQVILQRIQGDACQGASGGR
jgi:pimeloyl-ACP methyl ester carboxylesterase